MLTDDDYMLDVSGALSSDHVNTATRVWVLEARAIENGSIRTRYAPPSHVIGSDGALFMQVDARDLNVEDPPLDPKEYFATLGSALTAAGVTVSDSAARIKVVRNLGVFQPNPNHSFGSNSIDSHSLWTWHSSDNARVTRTPVFADRAFTATASWTSGSLNYELDATLEPGWNFVQYTRSGNDWKLTAVPATGTEEFEGFRNTKTGASGEVEEIAGVAWFTEHEDQASATPTSIYEYSYPSGNARLFVHNWLGFTDRLPALVPFNEVYPGVLDDTNMSFDPPEAVGLIAAPYAYSTTAVQESDWWDDTGRALGRIGMGSSDGHYVMMVYADRDVTISFTGPVTDILGSPLAADHVDLQLRYGWNWVEVVDEGTGEVWLRTTTELPASWGLFAR